MCLNTMLSLGLVKGQLLTTAITTDNTIRNNIKVTFSMYLGTDVFIYL